jgi:hypothetical protein
MYAPGIEFRQFPANLCQGAPVAKCVQHPRSNGISAQSPLGSIILDDELPFAPIAEYARGSKPPHGRRSLPPDHFFGFGGKQTNGSCTRIPISFSSFLRSRFKSLSSFGACFAACFIRRAWAPVRVFFALAFIATNSSHETDIESVCLRMSNTLSDRSTCTLKGTTNCCSGVPSSCRRRPSWPVRSRQVCRG